MPWAEKIDTDLHTTGGKTGNKAFITGEISNTITAGSYITGPRKVLKDNAVDGPLHYLVDTGIEEAFLNAGIFSEAQITGDQLNQPALVQGSLGTRFGVETFMSQNADVNVGALGGTFSDTALAINNTAGYDVNATSIVVDGGTGNYTFAANDTFQIAGHDVTYVFTAAQSLTSGAGTLTNFFPALRAPVANDAVVTLVQRNSIENSATTRNLMFHRNAIALGFAPLPNTGEVMGNSARIAVANDPDSGLSLRVRMWYNGATATNHVAFDALYGIEVIDPRQVVQVLRPTSVYSA